MKIKRGRDPEEWEGGGMFPLTLKGKLVHKYKRQLVKVLTKKKEVGRLRDELVELEYAIREELKKLGYEK